MPIMIWAAAGAAAMYLLDPRTGKQRREKLRERVNGLVGNNANVLETVDTKLSGWSDKITGLVGFGGGSGASGAPGMGGDMGASGSSGQEPAWAAGIGSGVSGMDHRGTDTPTAAEMQDDGAHDRGGWLTLDEAAQQFSMGRAEIQFALREGRITGRRVAGEGIAPENAPADTVVPAGATAPELGPQDDWLVQPEQMERLVRERASA